MTSPEQPFTDEEIAYLKAELPHNESVLYQCARKAFRMEALLSRLEAAEKLIGTPPLGPGIYRAYEAWRKAAGK